MRRLLLAAACVLITAVPAFAQTLRIALRQDLDVMDPTLATTYVGRIVFAGLCDKLFDIDEKLNIVPQLATGYEWADDRTLVIHLRSGVKFQNGEVMDAAAVKYSLERHLTMQGSFRKSEISSIDHVEVVDPATVRIVLKTPSGAFLAQLTDRAGMILPPKATEAAGKDFAAHPVCSGPFRFVERVPQDHVTLERFPDYWDAKDIHFDKLVYQILVDPSVRMANLKVGTVDITTDVVPTDAAAVKADPKLRLVVYDALGYFGITNNISNGPQANNPYGQSALVRQALDLAIDRAALVKVVFNDMFAPSVQAVPPSSPFYDEALQAPERDVAKAKALLKQAGVTLPVKLDLLAFNDSDILQASEVIQSMAAEAGFDVHIQAMEFASSIAGFGTRRLPGLHDRLVRPRRHRRQHLRLPAQRAGQQCQPLQQCDRRPAARRRAWHGGRGEAACTVWTDVAGIAAGSADHLPVERAQHRRHVGEAARASGRCRTA